MTVYCCDLYYSLITALEVSSPNTHAKLVALITDGIPGESAASLANVRFGSKEGFHWAPIVPPPGPRTSSRVSRRQLTSGTDWPVRPLKLVDGPSVGLLGNIRGPSCSSQGKKTETFDWTGDPFSWFCNADQAIAPATDSCAGAVPEWW